MSVAKNRLELTWIGKENRPKLEPRILIEDPEKSYHARHRVGEDDLFDNRLIFGDNLLALKALEQEFTGKVKCIYIDPPYNTGSAFEHYDDGLEHSIWLSLMRDRLEILWRLLHPTDGSLWISIDDREMAYLKVLLDEVCGRGSFVACNVWQKRYSRDNNSAIGDVHEYILTYARQVEAFKNGRHLVGLDEKSRKPYRNPDGDPKGPWQSISYTGEGYRPNQMYEIEGPDGRMHTPPVGRHWASLEPEYLKLKNEGRLWYGNNGKGVPRIKRYLSEVEGLVPWTWWPHEDVGHTGESKRESHALFSKEEAFSTPKPERLLHRVIHIATNPGDLVLDSFAGSGTTGAVAHKMGRRWIMVELGEHCHTHIIPRLRKVIDGDDPGGITQSVDWQGGGGFRYYKLGPTLIVADEWGNPVINPEFNAGMLAEAVCKVKGFVFAPSAEVYWQHGHSTENDFLYVTTQTLSREMLAKLSDEVGPNRSLLICCSAFRADAGQFPNLTVEKIPKAVLTRCEWGHDDYSLEVASLPAAPPKQEAAAAAGDGEEAKPRSFGKDARQPSLFDTEGL